MTEEIWRDIEGYEGLYQVSDQGRVKSLKRVIMKRDGRKLTINECILKPVATREGYLQVTLYAPGKQKILSVHRLVCEAFHENPHCKPQVNHVNENKKDNRACNLEWMTAKENMNFGTRNKRAGKKIAKALSKPVAQCTLDEKVIKVWQSTREAERKAGFNHSDIGHAANGRYKTHKGFIWKYIS